MAQTVSKGNKNNDTRDNIISVVVLSVVVIGLIALVLWRNGIFDTLKITEDRKVSLSTGKVIEGEISYTEEELSDKTSISVPGYDRLILKSNKKRQKVNLYNPKENSCYFALSLILEDGTVIWQSELLEPDTMFDYIFLTKELKAGNYENVTLKYDCFSLKDKTPLNGSEIVLNLLVK